ncbi:MAG: PAS domain-containing protein [Calditrichaceae bacterium]|nr:PAS domain-containing protein [Calditrichaceae bacterium]MBN2709822.1 PAS domain-containing protein [Calditrichaceae bacterium]
MIYNRFRLYYWIRIICIIITSGLLVYLLPLTDLLALPVLIGVVLVYQIFTLLRHVEKPQRDINRFFDAIRYSDFTQTFSDKSVDRSLSPMKEAFTKVMEAFQKTRSEKEAHFRYLQTVVEHIGVGILVFKADGKIDMFNRTFKKMVGIQRIQHIDDLSKISSRLPALLKEIQTGGRSRLQLQNTDTGDLITFSLYTARFIIQGQAYTIVSIQNIQSELDEKELEAWQNLIRVLTHEIMNSITPISSLASTAKEILRKSSLEKQKTDSLNEAFTDVAEAVQTIETRSKGLLRFVESYRQLTRLPKPDYKIVPIKSLFDQVEKLMRTQFDEQNINFQVRIEPKSLEITADPGLIEQVLINLLQNTLYWCGQVSGKTGEIRLEASMGSAGRPVIQLKDNGPGIQKEAIDKIFIPFFTTKKDGTGIGLSLSRQIMRLHKGTISVQSDPGRETVFTLRF